MNARVQLWDEAINDTAGDLAELDDDLAHSNEREAEMQTFLEYSDEPRRETRFRAGCGCLRFMERVSDDGETSYRTWSDWSELDCKGRK